MSVVLTEPLIQITDHAFDRGKDRLGLNKDSFQKLSEKAFTSGIKHSDTKGSLNKYISKVWFKYRVADNIRIYGEYLFLFQKNILITVYLLPNNLKKNAKKFKH